MIIFASVVGFLLGFGIASILASVARAKAVEDAFLAGKAHEARRIAERNALASKRGWHKRRNPDA